MTGWRLFFLSFVAVLAAGLGAFLLFQAVPEEPLDQAMLRTDALLSSSAAAGAGLWVPQLALAAPAANPTRAPILIALRPSRTPTKPKVGSLPKPSATAPQDTPEPTGTLGPSETPAPTETLGPSDTPAPTDTPGPTDTPKPTNTEGPSPTPPPTKTPAPTKAPPVAGGLTHAISGCGDINDPGGYYLTGNIGGSGDCINIRNSGVTLDCKGFAITGGGFNGDGIVVRKLGVLGSARPINVEIRGCSISGYHYGIYVEGSSGLYVHDNDVSRNYDDVDGRRYGIFLGMVEGGGIRLNESDGARIDNNNTANQAIGIDVRTSTGAKVRGNNSSGNSAWGVNLLGTTGSEVSGNTTEHNVRYCTWGAGVVGPGCDAGGIILQSGSSNNRILNNNVGSGNGNGIFIKAHGVPCGDNNVIAGNNIHDITYNSIEIGFCTGNQIIGNTMAYGIDGIWMGFSVNTTIKDNVISNQNNHGIISLNSHDNNITGNSLINDREGIYFFWEQKNQGDFWWLDINQYHSFKNCLCNNTLQDNIVAGVHLQNSTQNQVTGNTFTNNHKSVWVEGDSGGNNITDNHDSYLPGLSSPLAFRY